MGKSQSQLLATGDDNALIQASASYGHFSSSTRTLGHNTLNLGDLQRREPVASDGAESVEPPSCGLARHN